MIRRVAVIGAGVMGHGIAEVCALAGYDTAVADASVEALDRGLDAIHKSLGKLAEKGSISREAAGDAWHRMQRCDTIKAVVASADFVIEAATERRPVKLALFRELDGLAPADAILASNTSSLSITELGGATARGDRVAGLHFFNPPVLMKLVEVVRGAQTSDATLDRTLVFASSLGKTPLLVRKDVRCFVFNRMYYVPYVREASWMVSRGETTVEQADRAMRQEHGFPIGPFELQDLTGVDLGYNILIEGGDPVPPVIEEKVRLGELGRKTRKGFYDYSAGSRRGPDDGAGRSFDPSPIYAAFAAESAWLIENEVTTAAEIDAAMRLAAGLPDGILRRLEAWGIPRLVSVLDEMHARYGMETYRAPALLRKISAQERGFYG